MKRDLPVTTAPLAPSQVIHPHVGDWKRLMGSQSARAASAADLEPPPPRPRSLDHSQCPSRMGNELHYPDGRVTDLDGNPINHQE